MRPRLRSLRWLLLPPLLAVIIAMFLLAATESGLRFLVGTICRLAPISLTVDGLKGSFFRGFTCRQLQLDSPDLRLSLDGFALSWRPAALLTGTLWVDNLSGERLMLDVSDDSSSSEDIVLPDIVLPLTIHVEHVELPALQILNASEPLLAVTRILANGLHMERDRFRVADLGLRLPWASLQARGQIRTTGGYPITLQADATTAFDGYNPMAGRLSLSGPLNKLALSCAFTSPFPAEFTGQLFGLLAGSTGWQGVLQTGKANLNRISSQWPDLDLRDFRAGGAGTFSDYGVRVDSLVSFRDIADGAHVRGLVSGNGSGLILSGVKVDDRAGQILANGAMDWTGPFTWQASLSGSDVTEPAILPGIRARQLFLAATGVADQYLIQLDAEIVSPRPTGPWKMQTLLSGDGSGLVLHDLRAGQDEETLSGQGFLTWLNGLGWDAEIKGSNLNPGLVFDRWPGQLEFHLKTSGNLGPAGLSAAADLRHLSGELRNYPLKACGSGRLVRGSIEIPEFHLASGNSQLDLSGSIGRELTLTTLMTSPDLGQIWPDLRGSGQGAFALRGRPAAPDAKLSFKGEDIFLLDDYQARNLDISFTVGLAEQAILSGSVMGKDLSIAGSILSSIDLTLAGAPDAHQLQIMAESPSYSTSARLNGGVENGRWQGAVHETRLKHNRLGTWRQWQAAGMVLESGIAALDRFCLESEDAAEVCIGGDLEAQGRWRANLTLNNQPIDRLRRLGGLAFPIAGTMEAEIHLADDGVNGLQGNLVVAANDMATTISLGEDLEKNLRWQEQRLSATLDRGILNASLQSVLTDNSKVAAELALAGISLPLPALPAISLDGNVQIAAHDLSLINLVTSPWLTMDGSIGGEVALAGNLAAPILHGRLALENGTGTVPPMGIALDPLDLIVESTNDHIRLKARALSGNGVLRIESSQTLSEILGGTIRLAISGEHFKAMDTPDMTLILSPNLELDLNRKGPALTGRVLVDRAAITGIDLGGGVSPSRDVVILDDPDRRQEQDLPLSIRITVVSGRDVQLDVYGLKGKIKGELQIVDLPGMQQTGTGTLDIEQGSFTLYGRRLTINLGRLLFSGGPLTDPGIQLRAETKSKEVTAGVTVTGFLKHPEISFYSDPYLEQYQILSHLFAATAFGGETRKETGLVGEVATKAGLGDLVPYLQEAKELVGIDEIKLEAGKSMDDLSLVIGSWLTPSFYVSYGKNLLKESGSFNTSYTLGRGFFIKTETGATESGGDLKYEIER